MCLHLRRQRESSASVVASLRRAVARFGKPACVLTDNGSIFTSAEFKQALVALGIAHRRTEIASPWKNRIERMFGTLKEKLRLVSPQNGHALDVLLEDFTLWYNHARPHAHLHGWTPMQAWRGINPFITTPTCVEKFKAWGGLLQGYILHNPMRRC